MITNVGDDGFYQVVLIKDRRAGGSYIFSQSVLQIVVLFFSSLLLLSPGCQKHNSIPAQVIC